MILSAKEKLGWRGMFRVLRCTRWKSDVVWSLLITVSIFLILSLSWGCDWIGLLDKITQSLLSIYGGLLGVSIAAYALLLGLPHLRRIMGIILYLENQVLFMRRRTLSSPCIYCFNFSLYWEYLSPRYY